MKAILIDPFEQTVSRVDVQPEDLDLIRSLLDCENLLPYPLSEQDHIIVDAEGLEKPGQRFWRFQGIETVLGGRALILGNNQDGTANTDAHVDVTLVRNAMEWLDVRFAGFRQVPIFEPLSDTQTSIGAQPAGVAEIPHRSEPAPEAAVPAIQAEKDMRVWTIHTAEDGGYVAHLVSLSGPKPKRIARLENDDLEELRRMLPKGLQRTERAVTDNPSIVESWA